MASYQGTFADIKREITLLLRLAAEDDTDAGRWANLGYLDAVQRTEALQHVGYSDLTPGEGSYVLPDEVLMVKKLEIAYPDGSTSLPLEATNLEWILTARHGTPAAGQALDRPRYAQFGQSNIEIWPDAGANQKLWFWYVRYPQALVAPTDVPEIKEPFGSKLVTYGACVEAAKFKKDPLLTDFEAMYFNWVDRYQAFLNRQRNTSEFVFGSLDGGPLPHDPSSDWYARAS